MCTCVLANICICAHAHTRTGKRGAKLAGLQRDKGILTPCICKVMIFISKVMIFYKEGWAVSCFLPA